VCVSVRELRRHRAAVGDVGCAGAGGCESPRVRTGIAARYSLADDWGGGVAWWGRRPQLRPTVPGGPLARPADVSVSRHGPRTAVRRRRACKWPAPPPHHQARGAHPCLHPPTQSHTPTEIGRERVCVCVCVCVNVSVSERERAQVAPTHVHASVQHPYNGATADARVSWAWLAHRRRRCDRLLSRPSCVGSRSRRPATRASLTCRRNCIRRSAGARPQRPLPSAHAE
jgi:hypothetical protein